MPSFTALHYGFDSAVTQTLWPQRGYRVAWDPSGAAALNVNTDYSGWIQTAGYDLTGSSVAARMIFPSPASGTPVYPSGTFEIYYAIQLDANNLLQMWVSSQNMGCQKETAGVMTTVYQQPYVRSQHGPWWRISESGGHGDLRRESGRLQLDGPGDHSHADVEHHQSGPQHLLR
jgi:hypothetical protein